MKKFYVILFILLVAFFSKNLGFAGQFDEDAGIRHLYYSGAMTGYATPPQTVPYWNSPNAYWNSPNAYWNNCNSPYYCGYGYGYPNFVPYKPTSDDKGPYNFEVKPAGRVVINVDPEDAQVFVDGVRLQQLSDLSYQVTLLAGKQHIDIKKEGYEPFSQDIMIEPGSGLLLPVSLKKQETEIKKP